jgi:hypothetical protein
VSQLTGHPDVPTGTPLTATATYSAAYQQGSRLGIGTHPLVYNWGSAVWTRPDGSAFDLVAARFGLQDPAPPGSLRLLFDYTLAGVEQGALLTVLPVETAAGVLDLTQPIVNLVWVSGAQLQALIEEAIAASDDARQQAGRIEAALGGLASATTAAQAAADRANERALALGVTGLFYLPGESTATSYALQVLGPGAVLNTDTTTPVTVMGQTFDLPTYDISIGVGT